MTYVAGHVGCGETMLVSVAELLGYISLGVLMLFYSNGVSKDDFN